MVKGKDMEMRNRYRLQASIENLHDERLNFNPYDRFDVSSIGSKTREQDKTAVKGRCGGCVPHMQRHYCALTGDLLQSCSYNYVCLGKFTTDLLQKKLES